MTDYTVEQIADQVKQAISRQHTLAIAGGKTKAFYTNTTGDKTLSLTDYAGVIDYDPRELVITVKAGTKLSELNKVLAASGQMLASDSPSFGEEATVGGAIACGFSGSRRPYTGALRDYVLGVKIINGQGEVLRLGGQVMKNVAGFDVPRLMCGSFGVLGVITEVSLKVLPMPKGEVTQVLSIPLNYAAGKTRQALQAGLPITGSAYYKGYLYLRLSGGEKTLASAANIVGGETVDGKFWNALANHQLEYFETDSALWRVSLSADAVLSGIEEQVFDWGGCLRWIKADLESESIFAQAKACGGHATLFKGNTYHANSGAVLQPLTAAQWQWHKNLKKAFDPYGVFNPNQLYLGV